MLKMRVGAAIAFSSMLAMGGCDGSGGHQDADTVQADSVQQPVTGPEAAAQGTRISDAPPPAGTTGPTPPDGNPSPTTPMDPSQPGGPPATGGGVQPGTQSGGAGNGATPSPGGTQP